MTLFLGFLVGLGFGAALYLSDLANPDKIIGTLRLKDFHAMRVIGVFLLVGMLGVTALDLMGIAGLSVKPAAMLAVTVGGAFLGIGFGMTGYCPGTGLAAAASGRVDAMVTVLGMLAGTAAYIVSYRWLGGPIVEVWDLGKVTIPEVTGLPKAVWALGLGVAGFAALYLTRGGGEPSDAPPVQAELKSKPTSA